MKTWVQYFLVGLLVMSFPSAVFALSAEEIVTKSQAAYYYPGKDFKSKVSMKLIAKGGQERTRALTMIRKNFAQNNESGGEQKFYMYFSQPSDVKGMTFMVYRHPGADSQRWLFMPSLNMVRMIAAKDKASSFVGSDFTYEDVSGRNVGDDTHVLVKEEAAAGKDCYVITSTPKVNDMDYAYKISWIDKASFLPLKEEYYSNKGESYKVFSADEIKEIKGFSTITKRTMKNTQTGHMTEVVYLDADYNTNVDDGLFNERYLKQPPAWLIN